MEDKTKLEKIMREAKDLIGIFEELKNKAEINNNSFFFKYLDRVTIAKCIVPFLDLKDIINFRTTCKDVNSSISSTVALVSYYKSVAKKSQSSQPNFSNIMLKPFNELNDTDDIEMELESLKNIRDFLTQKLFQSESIIKLYKNDLEYLKSELDSQNEISERLSEALSHNRDELEDAKKHNMQLQQRLDETNKKFDENNAHHMKKTEDLLKTVDELKNERNVYSNGILKLKLIADDLKKKNIEKSEALKSIRNFFLTSTLFKIKNIADYEESYEKDKISKIENENLTKEDK